MRRDDSIGLSQGVLRRGRGVARPGSVAKSRLRRLSLEGLESRELLSTLPSPVTTLQSSVGGSQSGQGNSSSPSVAVDPLNPSKLIATWTTFDPGHKLDGDNGQVTTYTQAAYSTDGGQSWNSLTGGGMVSLNTQDDFSVAPPTNASQPHFAQTTDGSVAFGTNETAYLLTSSHGATSGVLDLQRFDFSGGSPLPVAFARNVYDTTFESTFLNPIYRWQGGDAAVTPTLAADPGTNSADPFGGNVYVAWQTLDTAPQGVTNFNAQAIKLVASSDGGQSFSYHEYLNGGTFASHSSGDRYTSPRIAISEGGGGSSAGQVTVVYDDAGPGGGPGPGPYYDLIQSQTVTGGTVVKQFSTGGGLVTNSATPTTFTIPVSIADARFVTLQNLSVTLSLSFPNLAQSSATLTAPNGTVVTLWAAATNATPPGGLAGANLGASTERGTGASKAYYVGTTLDSTAFRPLSGDSTVAAPYVGRFRPFDDLNVAFGGLTRAQIAGTWTLTITPTQAQTLSATVPAPELLGASLDFTSGLAANPTRNVATSYLNSGNQRFTDGVQGVPVFANPSIAADNTLGTRSPHQGRLYVAFTDDNYDTRNGAYTDSTFIRLYYSDNGGVSWVPDTLDTITGLRNGIVNDDNGVADGFSTGGFSQPGSGTGSINLAFRGEANVRPKLEPQVAVDSYTGTVVLSFLDARNDAARVRVATYVAASTDGGATFAPQVFANATVPRGTAPTPPSTRSPASR